MRPLRSRVSARWSDGDATLWLSVPRGAARWIAYPLDAQIIDVLNDPQPAWRSYVPRLDVNRLKHFLLKCDHRQELLDPWNQSVITWKVPKTNRAEQECFQTAEAIEEFLRNVGTQLCDTVGDFCSVKTHFPMLFYIHRLPELERIMRENPALFFVMCSEADTLQDRGEAISFLKDLCRRKYRCIAKALGFPNDNFLGRIRPEALNMKRLGRLKRIGRNSQTRRVFSHLREVGPSVIDLLVSRLYKQFENRFFAEISESQQAPDQPDLARKADQLFQLLDHCGVPFPRIQSLHHFESIYDKYFEYLDSEEIRGFMSTEFPAPPIHEEKDFITALRTPEQLLIESVKMENCSVSYDEQIYDRVCYFYRVEKKWGMCRATMQIVRRLCRDAS